MSHIAIPGGHAPTNLPLYFTNPPPGQCENYNHYYLPTQETVDRLRACINELETENKTLKIKLEAFEKHLTKPKKRKTTKKKRNA